MHTERFSWKGMKISFIGLIFFGIGIIIAFILEYVTNKQVVETLDNISTVSILIGGGIGFIGFTEHIEEMLNKK